MEQRRHHGVHFTLIAMARPPYHAPGDRFTPAGRRPMRNLPTLPFSSASVRGGIRGWASFHFTVGGARSEAAWWSYWVIAPHRMVCYNP